MTTRIMKHLLPALMLLAGACAQEVPPRTGAKTETPRPVAAQAPVETGRAPYAFAHPDISFALPEELREISGLTLLPDGHLGAVQDEEGILFVLNGETGAVEARHPFGEADDYEGIAWAGDRIFVLRSDGILLALTGWPEAAAQTRRYETALKRKNDTEGLVYDEARGRLLIACKEDPGSGLEDDQRAVYAFDLASGTLASEPAYVIDRQEVERQLGRRGTFKPSALAVHPTSGAVYVLSATANALAVLGEDGRLQHAWSLPKATFEQPEGLAFRPEGTLFIASEGDEGPAMLYRFSYRDAAR